MNEKNKKGARGKVVGSMASHRRRGKNQPLNCSTLFTGVGSQTAKMPSDGCRLKQTSNLYFLWPIRQGFQASLGRSSLGSRKRGTLSSWKKAVP